MFINLKMVRWNPSNIRVFTHVIARSERTVKELPVLRLASNDGVKSFYLSNTERQGVGWE